jgi:hypothetical protein
MKSDFIVLFENFEKDLIFYKMVDSRVIESIKEKGILPNKRGGTWLIMKDELENWTLENNLFGSFLQALLFFPSNRESDVYLLEIKTRSRNIKFRDVELLLKSFDQQKKSEVSIEDDVNYRVKEYILFERVPPSDIKIINKFRADKIISEFKIDPKNLMEYVLGKTSDLKPIKKLSRINLVSKFIWLKIKNAFGL